MNYYDNNYSYYLQVFHIHCLGPVFLFASHMQVSPQFSDRIIFSLTSLFVTDSCKVEFKDPNVLHEFTLTITPGKKVNLFPSFSVQTYCTLYLIDQLFSKFEGEGYWKDGIFIFHVLIPEDYNIKVSKKC